VPLRIHRLTSLFCAFALVVLSSCERSPGEGSCAGTTVQLRRPMILTVGVDLSFQPFAFSDPKTGDPTGFEVQLVSAIAKRLGLKLLLENRTSAALIPALLANRHDLAASGLRDTDTLRGEVCLSEPYLDADLGVAIAGGGQREINGTGDLKGRRVGVLAGSRSESWAKKHLPAGAVLTPLEAPEDILSSLEQGRIDAVVDEIPPLRFAEARTDVRVIQQIVTGQHYVLAAGADNGGLRDAVNAALDKLVTDGTLAKLRRRWFGI
jgi:ABC-type amino acid transport substrate-binding protein